MAKETDLPEDQSLSGLRIGSKKFLRLMYILKAADVMTVSYGDYEVTVETLQNDQNAFYVYDVIPTSSSPIDVYLVGGISSNALAMGGIQCCLIKRRIGINPSRIRVVLHISCTVSGPYTVAYKVYRIAGLV